MRGTEHTAIERELLALANRQHGVVHDGQLTRRGLTRRAIDHRVDTGRLTRLHDGVFSWGHRALTREGRWLSALWACPGAALSHGSAAAFHAIGREPSADVHVSTTKRSLHSRPGIVVHRVGRLDAVDVQRSSLLWVTRPPRTIVDLADTGGWGEVRGAADALRSFSPALLRGAQSRAPGRAGRGLVTRLLRGRGAHEVRARATVPALPAASRPSPPVRAQRVGRRLQGGLPLRRPAARGRARRARLPPAPRPDRGRPPP